VNRHRRTRPGKSLFKSSHVRVFLLLAIFGIAGCGGSSNSQPPPPQTGSLTITITGVPSGAVANILVTGPAGFQQTISATTTVNHLSPGAYNVAAPILPSGSNSSLLVPTYSSSAITVNTGTTATITVAYGSLSLSWTPIGPRHIQTTYLSGTFGAGEIGAIAVNNANPAVIYVACGGWFGPPSSTGVYKTTNGGANWAPSNNGLTDPAVAALWLDQANPNILIAGTLNVGMFRSTDAGASWQAISPGFGPTTALLQIGSSLYAGTRQGIAISQDEGATWNLAEPTTASVQALASSGTYIYAARSDGIVMVQSAPGGTWSTSSQLTCGASCVSGNNSLAASPANPLHAVVVGPDFWETSDGGATWQDIPNPLQWAVQYVAFDPSDSSGNTVYAGGDYLFASSSDGGQTWKQLTSGGDIRKIATQFAGTAGLVAIGSDQGIFTSNDGGNSWNSLNGDLTTSLLYGLDISGNTIVLATQDYAPIASFDGGATWSASLSANALCGEGPTVSINPGNPQYIYAYNAACGFWVSADGGATFQSVSADLNAPQYPGNNPQVIAVDPQFATNVYVAAQTWNGRPQGIWESTDSGVHFALKWSTAQIPSLIAFDPANDQNIFIGQQDGTFQVSHDGGKTWKSTMLGNAGNQSDPVASWPVSLSVNPGSPSVIILGMSGPPQQNDGGVLISSDGGNTFAPVSTGLGPNPLLYPQPWPDPLFAVAYDPSGSGLAAAARWDGVYLSSDNGRHWLSAQGNAIPLNFTSVKWSNGGLYATTFGQGVIRLPMQIQLTPGSGRRSH
jgi:photosystem II stability/assembly factor-like uncharacterized protein